MKIQRRKIKKIDIADSGALSDLAFLLIIFFIVIAVFNVNSGFILGIPRKNSTKIINTMDIMKFDLLDSGQIELDGEILPIDKLSGTINTNLEFHPNMTILLRVQREVSYQKVVSFVEVIRKLEVENFSFVLSDKDEL